MAFSIASVNRVRVTVNLAALESIFLPRGDVWDFARKLGVEMVAEAVTEAPARTGELKRQHGFVTTPNGSLSCRTTLYNDSDHAVFVHEGTPAMIYGRPYMVVRPAPHSWYSTYTARKSVRGQPPNPWMDDAKDAVLRRYGI